MKKELTIGLFSLLVLFQIGTPLSMISRRESALKSGQLFRFKTAPVDPYDAFRGRYVALRIEEETVPQPQGLNLNSNQKVYAYIAVDESGFAKLSTVSVARPKEGPYIEAKVRYVAGKEVFLELPIERYYMEETAAPAAEKIYREHSARNRQDAYVTVRIKNGFAVVEGLYIGGERIEDIVKGNKQ